jgi:Tetratricopeptide repeat
MRAHAATFLRDVESGPDSPQAGVAHRAAGITHWFAGEHGEARDHLERALTLFKPGRDDDMAFIRDAGLRWPDQDSALDRALDQLAA